MMDRNPPSIYGHDGRKKRTIHRRFSAKCVAKLIQLASSYITGESAYLDLIAAQTFGAVIETVLAEDHSSLSTSLTPGERAATGLCQYCCYEGIDSRVRTTWQTQCIRRLLTITPRHLTGDNAAVDDLVTEIFGIAIKAVLDVE